MHGIANSAKLKSTQTRFVYIGITYRIHYLSLRLWESTSTGAADIITNY